MQRNHDEFNRQHFGPSFNDRFNNNNNNNDFGNDNNDFGHNSNHWHNSFDRHAKNAAILGGGVMAIMILIWMLA